MQTIFLRQNVKNYREWKRSFNEHEEVRESLGMKNVDVFRNEKDPDTIMIVGQIENLDKKYKVTNDLYESMKNSGITGTPKVWLAE